MNVLTKVMTALAEFASQTRLYEFKLRQPRNDLGSGGLLVEAFSAEEELQTVATRDVIVLSNRARIDLASLLGQQATLEISLADGTRSAFGGYIVQTAKLGSNGGLARYRVRLAPWLWLLTKATNSRAWQDKTVIEIVESVFVQYQPHAVWTWTDEVQTFMANTATRSYCCQYRETDFDFIARLLTEEGLAWRFDQHDGDERLVIFADSSQLCGAPEDASSAAGGGVRFHSARSVEHSDAVQSLQVLRRLGIGHLSLQSYDYKSKRVISASIPTMVPLGGKNAPALESFDYPGQYVFADDGQARHYAEIQMQAHEARTKLWRGRSSIRTLRAGTRLAITAVPLKEFNGKAAELVSFRVTSVGLNNLPTPAIEGLAELFGPIPELLDNGIDRDAPLDFDFAIAQAQKTGYGNCFEAIPADRPWRPMLEGSAARINSKPTASGSQSAIVIGADGSDQPNGNDEVYCDRLGRVRIRFHWQDCDATCWVRVAQRSAGGGMGSQFLPRIGQEVLVQFLEGDIDRPIIVGALYNGQGEGGVVPTPGGIIDRESDTGVFGKATDHHLGGQGNVAAGNGPVWHGAAAGAAAHRNSAAQWGIRSKEFGGHGYNQIVFDDTDGQGRIQLKTTHAASELNLGHLIHTADNFRGSFRGTGAELRTDGYGAVRAGAGLLISSYKVEHSADARDPAGENAPAVSMLQQALKLAAGFSDAASTHQTVTYAAHIGAAKAGASAIDDQAAPLKALWTVTAGMVSKDSCAAAAADAGKHSTEPAESNLPHMTDPMVVIAAKAGLGVVAGQDVQVASGETVSLISGVDSQFTTGGQMRVHSGQAIGILAGAVKPGDRDTGLQLIAAKDAIDFQAQADELKVQARDEVDIISANAHIDWAAAKSISLSTEGGANITIDGGNITVQCPGKIMVHAGMKKFNGAASLPYALPPLPKSEISPRELKFKLRLADTPGPNGHALANTPWIIACGEKPDGMAFIDEKKIVARGKTDDKGNVVLSADEEKTLATAYCVNPGRTWLAYPGHTVLLDVTTESPEWNHKEQMFHAMNAADFSPDLRGHLYAEGARSQSTYAKEALGVKRSKEVLGKVKE